MSDNETVFPDGRTVKQWVADKEREALYEIMRHASWVRRGKLRSAIEREASGLLAIIQEEAEGREGPDA